MHKPLIGLIALGLALSACETDFQKKLKKRHDFAKTSVFKEIDRLIEVRRDKTKATMPDDLAEKRDGKPFALTWREDTARSDTIEQLEGLLNRLGDQNPKAEAQIKDALSVFRGQREYWVEKKSVQNYVKFLNDYLAFHKEGVLAEEAAFELVYLHIGQVFKREKYDEDTRLTSMRRFWTLAFEFPAERREPFMDYITRICGAKLKAFCKDIMWEHRPDAMEKPYLEALSARIAAFHTAHPKSIYRSLLERLDREFKNRAAQVGPFEEYPVMAETHSDRYCVGNLFLDVGPEGVVFEDEEMAMPEAGYKMTPKERKQLMTDLEDRLWKKVDAQGGTDPYIPLVTLRAQRDVPLPLVLDLIRVMQQNRVNEIALCGRNRGAGTNRKTMHLLTLFPKRASRKKEVLLDADGKVDKLTKTEKMDTEKFQALLPKKLAGKAANYLGILGKLPVLEIPPPAHLMRRDAKGWATAPLGDKARIGKVTQVEALDDKDKARPGVLFLKGLETLDELFVALDGAQLKCKPPAKPTKKGPAAPAPNTCTATEYLEHPIAIAVD